MAPTINPNVLDFTFGRFSIGCQFRISRMTSKIVRCWRWESRLQNGLLRQAHFQTSLKAWLTLVRIAWMIISMRILVWVHDIRRRHLLVSHHDHYSWNTMLLVNSSYFLSSLTPMTFSTGTAVMASRDLGGNGAHLPKKWCEIYFFLSGVVGEDFIVYGTSNLRIIDSRWAFGKEILNLDLHSSASFHFTSRLI